MNEDETIEKILRMKTVAVVGLSDKSDRPSFRVASYLAGNGYEIIPVNPSISEWMGRKSYPDLLAVPTRIDVVDVFRKSEAVPEIAEQAVRVGAKALWLQEGVINEAAARKAEEAGLLVVMDRCLMGEHARAGNSLR